VKDALMQKGAYKAFKSLRDNLVINGIGDKYVQTVEKVASLIAGQGY
jgi:hypothetical protein